MDDAAYVYLWSFQVRPDRVADFERIYGVDGDWVALFRRAAGYRSTRLLRDREHATRYVTIDEWESADAFRLFRQAHAEEFEALDRRCEDLTVSEQAIGRFDALA